MNKTITSMLAAAMLAVSACSLNAQPNFTLTLPVPADNNNSMAYLINWDSSQKIDSVLVTDGVVKFAGNVDEPFIGTVSVNGGRGPVVIIEPGDIVLSESMQASGTPLNDKLESYMKRRNEIVQEFRTLDQNDSIQMEKAKVLEKEYNQISQKAYAENAGNPVGLFWFLQDAYEMDLAGIDAAIAKDPALGASKRLESLRTSLQAKAETSEGKHYKDFTVSYNGKEEKLSDYVKPGRFTLVDFWASWCGPCIRQTKVIKELYAKYKDKGLDVVGVAVWDEPDNTFKAIKQHDLQWPCIVNAQTVPTDLYGISGIPCIILINPEGIIVSRDKMSQELIDAVDSAMAGFEPQAAAVVSADKDTAAVKATDVIF
ncbi:TlpA disulfide reductase family protein [Duncaniella muris]|uniref:TlpA disulfide reductase family protein n=1 Tax=Duncaniella muris TaxID=2094150 RepID=UPI002714AEF7|nr:TlpA disulfide reductase family protein [Duncaniella muris]